MLAKIKTALHDFAQGQISKGGFTQLEMHLAQLRHEATFDPTEFDAFLASLVEEGDVGEENFAIGVSLTAKKSECYGHKLRDALERKLFTPDSILSPRSQFELSKLLIKCGGEFAPKQLNQLVELKNEKPELWLDLALEAYPHDVQGLLSEIGSLFKADITPLRWESLKPRYLKLIAVVPNGNFNEFALDLSSFLSAKKSKQFLSWVSGKRGTKLSPRKEKKMRRGKSQPIVDEGALAFIGHNSPWAERIAA